MKPEPEAVLWHGLNHCSNITSYGHNIEGSWLIYEAAGILGNAGFLNRNMLREMAERVLKTAWTPNTAVFITI